MLDKTLSPQMRQQMFGREFSDAISSSAVKNIFEALGAAAPADRYRLLQAGAAEVGRPNWSCPAVETIYAPLPKPEEKKPIIAPQPAEEIAGVLDKASVKRTITRVGAQTKRCYAKELQKDPKLEGRVVVAFTIDAKGLVKAATATDESLGNEKVGACVVDVIKTLRFARPADGEQKINYPFVFTPG